MHPHRLLRPLGILVFSVLLVCRTNADLYVSAIGVVSSGVARFIETNPPNYVRTFASALAPTGLAFGPDGNLYVAVMSGAVGYEVDRFDRSGNFLNVVVSALPGANITALAFGPDGNLYLGVSNLQVSLLETFNGVLRLNRTTGGLEIFAPLAVGT